MNQCALHAWSFLIETEYKALFPLTSLNYSLALETGLGEVGHAETEHSWTDLRDWIVSEASLGYSLEVTLGQTRSLG